MLGVSAGFGDPRASRPLPKLGFSRHLRRAPFEPHAWQGHEGVFARARGPTHGDRATHPLRCAAHSPGDPPRPEPPGPVPRDPEPVLQPFPRSRRQELWVGQARRGAHLHGAVVGWGGLGVLTLLRGPVQLLQVPELQRGQPGVCRDGGAPWVGAPPGRVSVPRPRTDQALVQCPGAPPAPAPPELPCPSSTHCGCRTR